jgi:hypothetical protein
MNPELPKVNTDKEEILKSLEGQFGGEVTSEFPVKPKIDSQELNRVGSLGIEAGLRDFEARPTGSDGSGDDDDDSDEGDGPIGNASQTVDPKRVVGATAISQTPEAAGDGDEIEREWVSKAKKIVEQTKGDPFLQERAISRLQADYMKKRFNKKINLPNEDK